MIRTNCIVKEDDMSSINKNKYLSLTEKSFYKKLGKVTKIVGLTIESVGPDAKLNDLCRIYSADNSQELYAEVVGFNDSNVLLMPYDVVDGIGPGSVVENMERPFSLCGWRERTVRFGVSRKRFLPIVQQYRPSSADSRADARHVRKGWSMSSCLQG